jgi:plastocyanin
MNAPVRGVRALAIALSSLLVVSAHAAPKTVEVLIEHFAFVPSSVDVKPGDTVVFINRDITPHTATAVDGSWTTGDIASGQSVKIVMPERGSGGYFCRYHPAMKATLKTEIGQ